MAGLNLSPMATSALGNAVASAPGLALQQQQEQAKTSVMNNQATTSNMQVGGEQAYSKLMADQMKDYQPSDDQFANLDAQIKARQQTIPQLAGLNFGQKSQDVQKEVQDLQQQRMDMGFTQLGKAAQAGDMNRMLDIGHKSGNLPPNVVKIELDPKGENFIGRDADGKIVTGMNREAAEHMGYTNAELATMEEKKFMAEYLLKGKQYAADQGLQGRQYAADRGVDKEEIKAALPQDELGKIEKSVRAGLVSREEADAYIKFKETVKPSTMSLLMQPLPGMGNPTFESDPSKPWRDTPKFQEMVKRYPTLAPDVDQYLNGDYKIGGGRGVAVDRQVQRIGAALDSNVSQHDYDLKQKALADPKVASGNAALGHLGDWSTTFAALPKDTQSVVMNHSMNWLREHASDSPDLYRLATISQSLSGEWNNFVAGSRSLQELEAGKALLNRDLPLKSGLATASSIGDLIKQSFNARENMLNRNNPNRVPLSLVDPAGIDTFKQLGVDYHPGGRVGKAAVKATPEAKSPVAPKASADDAYKALMNLGSK
jgi:hypothetical protein